MPSSDGDGAYSVSWGSSTTATSYTLQQKVGGGSWASAYSGGSRNKSYFGKAEGTYYYRVRACNASGCGAWSGTKTLVVDYPVITYFDVTPRVLVSGGSVTVTWQSSNAAYCEVRQNGTQFGGNQPANGSKILYFGARGSVEVKCINGSKSHAQSASVTVKYGGGGGGPL